MSRKLQTKPAAKAASPRRSPTTTAGLLPRLADTSPSAKSVAQKLLRTHGFHDVARVLAAIGRLHEDELQRRNLVTIFNHLLRACAKSADPDRALVNFERLVAALPNPNIFYHYLHESPDRLDLLVTIFAHSQALADTLTRNAGHFHFLIAPQTLEKPREKAWLAAELQRLLLSIRVTAEKYDAIRRFRRRETLRIGARDLMGGATVEETTLELSNLADVCLQSVFEIALGSLRAQYKLKETAIAPTSRFSIIGMGKLGGQELNYSSDVDVIFIYAEEGALTPTLTNHQFFTKLAEEIIRAVAASSAEGNIFRIDLRLRPEGKSGPLVRSLESGENYYAEFGETWERMALIKARPVAGDGKVGAEFIAMVQPFVYARHAGENVIQQMASLKKRIEEEVVREGHLTRHVKLGIGGIREIEFIVQAFQVLRGARLTQLRDRNTLRTLAALVKTKTLSATEATTLADAYRFLRNVEHRLQMEMELQTHTIPDEEHALYRLARSLGFDTVRKFRAAQEAQTAAVRKIYASVLADAGVSGISHTAETLLAADKLPELLAGAGFLDPPAALKAITNLWEGPGFGHVSQRTKDLFVSVFPALLNWCGQVADPDAALARFDKFVGAYGSRGLLYEIFASHPKLVEMLVKLGDASRYLSEALARQPEVLDEISGGALSDPKGLDRFCGELGAALEEDSDPMLVARRWKQSEMVRIGIEDVMGLVDLEQLHTELTALAEACLRLAVQQAQKQLGLKRLPFLVIGMGKFGGRELGYGADLDVLFVGGTGSNDQTQVIKLASTVIDFMSRQTGDGALFPVDARLRPDGAQGTLAGSLEAHRDYYAKRAQLWERQALTKARFVAGDPKLGQDFIRMVHETIYSRAATTEEWKQIGQMRHRVETERGDPQHADLEFKTGPGGLVDVEFLLQALQLRHGHAHPQLRTAHTLAVLNRLTTLGIIEEDRSATLRKNYLFLRRIESVLRRVENTSISKIPLDEREQQRVAKRLGFPTVTEFLKTYCHTTRKTREIYELVLSAM